MYLFLVIFYFADDKLGPLFGWLLVADLALKVFGFFAKASGLAPSSGKARKPIPVMRQRRGPYRKGLFTR